MRDLTATSTTGLYNMRDLIKYDIRVCRERLLKRTHLMVRCETNNPTGLSIDTHGRLLTDINEELVLLHQHFVEVSKEIIRRRKEDLAA